MYLNTENLSAYYNVCSISAYATTLVHTSPTIPNVTWNPALDAVKVDGKILRMSALRNGCKELSEAIDKLLDTLMDGHDIPIQMPEDIGDNLANDEMGYSYLDLHEYTSKDALLNAFLNDPSSKLFYLGPDGKPCLNHREAHSWMVKAAQLNSLFGFSIHITGGQPPRAPEVTDARIRNGERKRGLMKDHNHLFVVSLQSKSSNLTGKDKLNVRKLAETTMHQLDKYLIIIRPLEALLGRLLYDTNEDQSAGRAYHSFLMVQFGKKIEGDSYSDKFPDIFKKFMRVRMNISDYRHIAIGIKREYIPPVYWKLDDLEEVGDNQAGHSSGVATVHYARISEASQYLGTTAFIQYSRFSSSWHQVIGMSSDLPSLPLRKNPAYQRSMMLLPHPHIESEGVDPHDFEPLAHGVGQEAPQDQVAPQVQGTTMFSRSEAKQVFKQMLDERDAAMEERLENIVAKATSAAVNTLMLHQRSSLHSRSNEPHILSQPTNLEHDVQPPFQDHDPQADRILEEMRNLYGNPNMMFTCNGQKQVLKNSLDPNEDIIAVMPTGSGKSMIMELPPSAWDQASVTVAVIPFKAILEQQLAKCKSRGINCAHWTGPHVTAHREYSLLFVSVETAVGKAFTQSVLFSTIL